MKSEKSTPAANSEAELLREMEGAIIPSKRRSYSATDAPKISVKKHGRVVLNRPAADALAERGEYVLMMINPAYRRLYIMSASQDDVKSHKIAYGRGGIPGLIAGKATLTAMGLDLTKNHPPMEVKIQPISSERKIGQVKVRPGDVVIVADLPKGIMTGEEQTDATPRRRGCTGSRS